MNPWGINIALPGIDVETVGLHENGHSLEIGHFGPPPVAVMNPVYGGIRHSPFGVDHAGMCAVWGRGRISSQLRKPQAGRRYNLRPACRSFALF